MKAPPALGSSPLFTPSLQGFPQCCGRIHPAGESIPYWRSPQIGRIVVDAAIKVHKTLGPGLLESVYEVVLAHELTARGLQVDRQVPVSIEYEGMKFNEGFQADIIVEGKAILELKSVESVCNAHKKQILTYLKLTGLRLGFLLNFGEAVMKDGITRTVNGMPEY